MSTHGQPPVRRLRSAFFLDAKPLRWMARIRPSGKVAALPILVGRGRRPSRIQRHSVVR